MMENKEVRILKYLVNTIEKLSESQINCLLDGSGMLIYVNVNKPESKSFQYDIEILKNAPVLYSYLNDDTKNYFEKILSALSYAEIQFQVDHKLVRGFDFYS